MTLAGAEIGEYMESMEMRPALPESNGFPAAAANSWYSPPGSAGEKVAYGYDTLLRSMWAAHGARCKDSIMGRLG